MVKLVGMKPYRMLLVAAGIIVALLFILTVPRLWRQTIGLNHQAANRRLFDAILHNDTQKVREALKAGAAPNAEMEGWDWTDFAPPLTNLWQGDNNRHRRDTPLLLTMDSLIKRDVRSVRSNNIPLENLATVQALVEAGAEVNARNRIGNTALHMAVDWGYCDTARYLMQHGADPNLAEDGGMTPLHSAAAGGDPKLVRDLLERGADPNAKDILGSTPLFMAALPPETPQQIEIVRILLKYHAEPTIKDHDGLTVLDHAKHDDRSGILKIIQQHQAN